MKIDVKAGALADAMKHVAKVVERRNTIPVLANVMLGATKAGLNITGTDLDICFSAQIDALTDAAKVKPGLVTVEAHLLAKIAAIFDKDARLTLEESEPGKLVVTGTGGDGDVRYKLPTLPAADFPTFVDPDWPCQFEIEPRLFAAALERVRFAVSTEERRYYLNGIFMHQNPAGALTLAATDGHRLAVTDLTMPEGAEGLPDVIIPRKVVGLLADLCAAKAKTEGKGADATMLSVQVHARRLCFDLGSIRLDAKTIDGTFPDYTRVIPSANPGRLTVRPQAWHDAVSRVALVSSKKTRALRVVLHKDAMDLSVISPEHGVAEDRLGCAYVGDDLTIGFNASYLSDVLSHLSPAETCEIETADASAPTLFKAGPDSATRYVLMPMRV